MSRDLADKEEIRHRQDSPMQHRPHKLRGACGGEKHVLERLGLELAGRLTKQSTGQETNDAPEENQVEVREVLLDVPQRGVGVVRLARAECSWLLCGDIGASVALEAVCDVSGMYGVRGGVGTYTVVVYGSCVVSSKLQAG
jgi:hypothetical protein